MVLRGVSLLDMDFGKEFPFEFAVQSYGCTKLNVMYTNDTDSVKLCLASVLWLHQVLEHLPVSSAAPTAPSLRWREGRTRRFGIWCNKLGDIQKQYKIISNGQEKDSVVDLAETIIDP